MDAGIVLFRAASKVFPVMLQNNVVTGPQRTAGGVPPKAEAAAGAPEAIE
jgi:hypothetical protein